MTQDALPSSPPSYAQATAPPPSYQSLYGEIKDVRKNSNNIFEFFLGLTILLASTIGFAIFLGVLLAIPISMIVLGAKYKDDCPREDMIPIYLIVMGSVLIVRNLSSMCTRRTSGDDDDDEDKRSAPHKCCDSILDLFVFSWFIAGNYWIYHIYKPSYNEQSDDYCNKTLYLFSFWIMTTAYICFVVCCCCLCTIGACVACVSDDD